MNYWDIKVTFIINIKSVTLSNAKLKIKNISSNSTLQLIKSESICTAWNVLADGLKAFLTSSENKPATKKDIAELKSLMTQRYLPIYNLGKNQFGQSPFYDMDTKNVVYLN